MNPSFGLAVRIAELRRTAPDHAPSAGVLVAAEMPIVVVEIALAGLCSFTLIGPLGIPWWLPLIALVVGVGVVAGMSGIANRKQHGLWQGLAVLRGLRHRNTIIALTVLAVSAQVFRNWLVLRGIGVDVSVFDSMALLIATAALGLLPGRSQPRGRHHRPDPRLQGGRPDGRRRRPADRDRSGRGDDLRLVGTARPLADPVPIREARLTARAR